MNTSILYRRVLLSPRAYPHTLPLSQVETTSQTQPIPEEAQIPHRNASCLDSSPPTQPPLHASFDAAPYSPPIHKHTKFRHSTPPRSFGRAIYTHKSAFSPHQSQTSTGVPGDTLHVAASTHPPHPFARPFPPRYS
ncbi:hypothetical protein NMY22_g7563 [Coprinellus aureogranulatus]|nr:hypothetical protein NMY22_g7563 [Coprinellus aureogranulatus]